MRRVAIVAVLAAAVISLPSVASAAGYTLGFYGGVYGHTNASGGLAVYWNPGRIANETGLRLTLDTTLVYRFATYDRIMTPELSTDPTAEPGDPYYELNSGEARLSNLAALPYLAGAGAFALSDGVNLGFSAGIIPHYGGGGDWDLDENAPAEYPGALYGPQRWSAIRSSLLVLHYTMGTAISLTDFGLDIGGTVEVVTGEIHTTRSRNVDRSDRLTDSDGNILEGRIYFTGTDTKLAYTVGASYTNGNVTASAVYRSSYTLELVGPLRQVYGTNDQTRVEAYLEFQTPHVFQTTISARFGPIELTGFTDYSTWTELNDGNSRYTGNEPCEGNDTLVNETGERLLCIPRSLENTFSARGMATWYYLEHLRFSFSFGWDPSSVPERTLAPDLPDGDKFRVGIGGYWSPNDNLAFMLSWQHDFIRDVTVTNSEQEPHANGDYHETRDYVNLSVEGRF